MVGYVLPIADLRFAAESYCHMPGALLCFKMAALTQERAQARKELADLQKAAALHDREAASLTLVRRRLSEAETLTERLRFENEVGAIWTCFFGHPCIAKLA